MLETNALWLSSQCLAARVARLLVLTNFLFPKRERNIVTKVREDVTKGKF